MAIAPAYTPTPGDNATCEPPTLIQCEQLADAVRWCLQEQNNAIGSEPVLREVRATIRRGAPDAIVLQLGSRRSRLYRLSPVRDPGLLAEIDVIAGTVHVRIRHLLPPYTDPTWLKALRAEAVASGMPGYLKAYEILERISKQNGRLPAHLWHEGLRRGAAEDVAARLGIAFNAVAEDEVTKFLRRLDNGKSCSFSVARDWLEREVQLICHRLASSQRPALGKELKTLPVEVVKIHEEAAAVLRSPTPPASGGTPLSPLSTDDKQRKAQEFGQKHPGITGIKLYNLYREARKNDASLPRLPRKLFPVRPKPGRPEN
jgi:hypothetical protein